MKRLFCVLTVVCALGLITFQSLARAQEKIKVMSDGPLRPAFEQITEAFRRETGSQLEFVFGTSPVVHKKVAEGVKAKVIRLDPFAVNERVIQGKGTDIGVGVIPLINTTKGLRLLGPLPAEIQSYIVYVAAPMTSSTSPQAGKAFIKFLASPTAKAAFAANGVE